jgi:hypothetical protein
MFEFNPQYNLNTGNLQEIFYASGVHLNRDVKLIFNFRDVQSNYINNTEDLISNRYIKQIDYDILDISGNIVYENFESSLTQSFSLSEEQNISIFGEYRKDFGVRATLSNFLNDQKFISEYYLYANTPQISGILIQDGNGERLYSESLEILNTSGVENGVIYLNIYYYNNLNYMSMDKIDIYASPSSEVLYPSIVEENFHSTFYIYDADDLLQTTLNKNNLDYNVDYNFTIVPYSKIGSGEPFYISSGRFKTPEETGLGVAAPTEVNNVLLTNNVKIDTITGEINKNKESIIDIIEKDKYNLAKYTTKIISNNGNIASSEIKIISNKISGSKYNVSISEYAIIDPFSLNVKFDIEDSDEFIYFKVNEINENSNFLMHRLLM